MRLLLSPIQENKFSVLIGASPVGEPENDQRVEIDFGELVRQRKTILKCLNAVSFEKKDYDPEELVWMKNAGLLKDDETIFHRDLQKKIGNMLYDKLFPKNGKIRDFLSRSLDISEYNKQLLHLQLQIESKIGQFVPIFDFPWELMCDEKDFLAKNRASISRYIAYDRPPPQFSSHEKVNVLLISSQAYDLKNGLDEILSEEQKEIISCLELKHVQTGKQSKRIHLEVLKTATLEAFSEYLRSHRGSQIPHIIHFDGHGFFGKQCKNCLSEFHRVGDETCRSCGKQDFTNSQGYLLFEHKDNHVEYVSADKFAIQLGNADLHRRGTMKDHIALIVLSACRSAVSLFKDSIFNGVAQNLIHAGIPAVVAMQFSVTVAGAAKFTRSFYLSLGEEDPLVMAMNEGRVAMGYDKDQWYRPVLYLRWQDMEGAQLFTSTELIEDIDPVPPGAALSFADQLSQLFGKVDEKLQVNQNGKQVIPYAHKIFFGTGIGPTSCKRAREELQLFQVPLQQLAELINSDNASILNLSDEEVKVLNSIRHPIYESCDILNRLVTLINQFISISRDTSKDMMRCLSEIQTFVRELENYFTIIKKTINNYG